MYTNGMGELLRHLAISVCIVLPSAFIAGLVSGLLGATNVGYALYWSFSFLIGNTSPVSNAVNAITGIVLLAPIFFLLLFLLTRFIHRYVKSLHTRTLASLSAVVAMSYVVAIALFSGWRGLEIDIALMVIVLPIAAILSVERGLR